MKKLVCIVLLLVVVLGASFALVACEGELKTVTFALMDETDSVVFRTTYQTRANTIKKMLNEIQLKKSNGITFTFGADGGYLTGVTYADVDYSSARKADYFLSSYSNTTNPLLQADYGGAFPWENQDFYPTAKGVAEMPLWEGGIYLIRFMTL